MSKRQVNDTCGLRGPPVPPAKRQDVDIVETFAEYDDEYVIGYPDYAVNKHNRFYKFLTSEQLEMFARYKQLLYPTRANAFEFILTLTISQLEYVGK